MKFLELAQNLSIYEVYFFQYLVAIFRYFAIVAAVYIVFWVWLKRPLENRKYSSPKSINNQILFESKYSLITHLNHAIPTVILFKTTTWLSGRIYYDINEYPISWYFISFFLMIILHDAYFYWTHRIFHNPKLYRMFHHIHHKSVQVTPFTAYSFHFVEGFVQMLVFVLFLTLFPLHVSSLGLFFFVSFLFNVYGHTGIDFTSRNFRELPGLNLIAYSTNHAQHHLRFNGNYGLYFKFWDKIMGTYIGEYGDRKDSKK